MEVIQVSLGGKEMVNAFIIKGERKAIVVDAGNPGSGARIVKALSQNNIRKEDVGLILLTHAHRDHYGGAAELKALLRNAPLAIQKNGTFYIMAGEIAPIVWKGARGFLAQPFTSRGEIRPVVPDLEFQERISLNPFGVEGEVISTPGHTRCSSIIILANGECIVGDTLMFRIPFKHIPAKPLFALDQAACLQVMARLVGNGNKISKIYAGHGGPWSAEKVKKCVLS